MDDRKLLTGGGIAAVIAAICCFTPALGIALGAFGLAAWLARADLVMLPVLMLCLVIVGVVAGPLWCSRQGSR
ncbi:MAG TPA: mercury resistance system transport protein MerF [Alphaproteobacteria bacterium]|nr:mercury resistance system transport protein MerF [Alphaproteobacteria bacterium]